DDAQDDAALGRAVELGQGDSAHRDRLLEELSLLDGVLPGGRVEDEEDFVDRSLERLLGGAYDLLELLHQVGLRVEPARRVRDDEIGGLVLGLLDRIEDHARGVGALLSFDDVTADASAPDLELDDRCGADGVACRENDLLTALFVAALDLPDKAEGPTA